MYNAVLGSDHWEWLRNRRAVTQEDIPFTCCAFLQEYERRPSKYTAFIGMQLCTLTCTYQLWTSLLKLQMVSDFPTKLHCHSFHLHFVHEIGLLLVRGHISLVLPSWPHDWSNSFSFVVQVHLLLALLSYML